MKLRADLRSLLDNQETTSLSDKVFVGETTLPVVNAESFATDDFVLIGILGTETAEIRKVSSVTSTTIVLTAALEFDHSQDTVITLFDYDQVIFYRSASLTGSLTALATQNLVVDNVYNTYNDTVNNTGYGWFRFYNSVTTLSSGLSNAIPYAGWADNSVKMMLDRFYSQISNRQRILIKDSDVYGWLNEAYTKARNRLNLSNREYTVPTPETITIVAGTQEYVLPTNFSKVRMVATSAGVPISEIAFENTPDWESSIIPPGSTPQTKYYIRGNYIGFSPTPTENTTYDLYYSTTAPVLSSYVDYIELPNANHYFLIDFLMYRAASIIGGNPEKHLAAFNGGLDELVVTSHKQGGDRDSWGMDPRTLV